MSHENDIFRVHPSTLPISHIHNREFQERRFENSETSYNSRMNADEVCRFCAIEVRLSARIRNRVDGFGGSVSRIILRISSRAASRNVSLSKGVTPVSNS